MAVPVILELHGLQALIDALGERGHRVIGPALRSGAIVPAEIERIDDLPRGIGDAQQPGRYGTRTREDDALFGFAAPAQSAKPFLLAPDEMLWRGTRTGDGYEVSTDGPGGGAASPKVALIGVRGCDLAAIGIQDTVLRGRSAVDTHYASRRDGTFLVAVTCTDPAGTCFCVSMGTGPKPGPGADLTLTELLDDEGHRFLAEAGTEAGEELLDALPATEASPADRAAMSAVVAEASGRMGRSLATEDLRDLLYSSAERQRWNEVATRCLACTNCTMVCPTCFCTSVEDVSDLSGESDERHRVWDSCFSMEYSRLHGGAVRTSTAARYRQWLTHKLAAWVDQFGMSGCVGCGRCITWCPAGIDLTEEVAALRQELGGAPVPTPLGPARKED